MATATRTSPQPPPSDTITLELSEEEAEYILGAVGPHTGPIAVRIYNALDKDVMVRRHSESAELGRQKTKDAR